MIFISSIDFVYAKEYPEITNDIEIRYRWYKERVSSAGKYVPKKELASTDIVNKNHYKTGSYSEWKEEYCNLSTENYEISRNKYITYKKIDNVKYIQIENITYDNNIKIFNNNQLINFEILSNEENKIKIKLDNFYLVENLMFYVDTSTNYKISIYSSVMFVETLLKKETTGEKFAIPDKSWIQENTRFNEIRTTDVYPNSVFTAKIKEENICRYRDILLYKYDIEREYYDNNYYLNLDGYIKDINDYKIFYKGEPITNTVEIITEKIIEVPKIIKEPQIKYVYVQEEKNDEKDPSIKEECLPEIIKETKTEIKQEIVEKEVEKIPKKIYIIIISLIIIILILFIKLYKKYVV